MRILITGGAGFIGSHLAERLVEQGHDVIVFDRKPMDGWAHTFTGYWGLQRDCRDLGYATLDEWSELGQRPDFIYHLAATVGVSRVLEDPSECISNNVDGLRAVLNLGIPGLFTSTSEVYGINHEPLREDSRLVYSQRPRWAYATSKLIGEWMALQAGWKVVRLFNVVGPRQSSEYGAVLPNFVKQTLARGPLTVYGDGSQVRTFIDVRDCVEILDRLREKEFDVVNVGGTHVMSVVDLAAAVSGELDPYLGIKLVDYAHAYPAGFEECLSRVPDLSRLDSLLPERPHTEFSKTIRDLAEAIKPTLEVQDVEV